jgi:3-dehydroquinate dehydratase-2
MTKNIAIIHGPNLNTLGSREPEIYGHETLDDINKKCIEKAKSLGLSAECYQSNHEGELVSKIQEAGKNAAGIIVNAGAYTHTSIAMMDALLTVKTPVIEVHLSNIFKREEFRHQSYISKAAKGVICGFGSDSYMLALEAMKKLVKA